MVAANTSHSNQTVLEQVGPNIIHHVSNSDIAHPIIHLPSFFGIDFSVTKHVLMLWLVALIVSIVVILPIRKYLSSNGKKKSNWVTLIEYIVEFVKDTIAAPNVGPNWVMTWTPLFLTFFFFILFANGIGMIPIFDTIGLLDRFLLMTDSHSTINNLLHGGVTATGNFNVTAGLAAVTFFSIIIAGVKKHGFIKHWANLVPHGLAWPVYIILIPIELMGLFVKPFALTMRLAANMTGGHIAILALLSLMAIIGEMFSSAAGIGVAFVSIPMAAAISGLEIIVVLVQAYVFTLLTAVFVGMAINVHH
ncbi:F0F1 ATP synthase subunit A [bacterium]|nr:F0F1 ATP synthase subunit A [bacterium]MDA9594420.1 F0F1 ATP synthase subunit A [bacterium]